MSILVNETGNIAYSEAHSATFAIVDIKPIPLTSPVQKDLSGNKELSAWGTSNDHPQQIYSKSKKNTIIPSVIDWKIKAAYGNGIVYGMMEPNGQDEYVFKRKYFPEIELWLKRTNAKRYGFEILQQLYWFANGFAEIVRSADGKTITTLAAQDSCWCRFGIPNTKGIIDKCFINANWADGAKVSDPLTTPRDLIDAYYNAAETLRLVDRKTTNFIYPVTVSSPERAIYQDAAWHSLFDSKWLEVAEAIPAFKQQLFKNQISIKYHIEINKEYWEWKYQGWDGRKDEEKAAILKKEKEEFDKIMTGLDGVGKSIFTNFVYDKATGKDVVGWRVTPIDDKIKSGIYIEDSQEAASHIYTALQVDPTLIGVSPGKNMGSGSGSDKRVAFNNYISTQQPVLQFALEPLDLISQYNLWPENLVWKYENPMIMTLDSGSQVKKAQQETK